MSDPPPFDHDKFFAILEAEQHEYHAAIGRLMLKWAVIERQLYMLLLRYGKLSDEVGRAVLSGTRASTMIDFLKAVVHNKNLPTARVNDLKYVFDQISVINTMRDRIVHFGSWAFQGVFDGTKHSFEQFITNEERASRGHASSFMVPVSTKSINLMVDDLETIVAHLNRHFGKRKFQPHRKPSDASTWLYKSPQPISTKRRSRVTARKPSGRRRPSHG